MRLEPNFTAVYPCRSESKAQGLLNPEAMDSYDELHVINATEQKARDIDKLFPGLPGSRAKNRLNELFGSGRNCAPRPPEQISKDLKLLSINVSPQYEKRLLYRGGSIFPYQIDAIKRNYRNGNDEDNHAVAYVLMHGYVMPDGTRSKLRPPSVSSVEHIAEGYAKSQNPEGTKELYLKLKATALSLIKGGPRG